MADLTPDYSKRDCSLPLGCKDLMDVLNLEKRKTSKSEKTLNKSFAESLNTGQSSPKSKSPPEGKNVELNPTTAVKDLAKLIVIRPFMIVADLMELGIFANVNESVSFDVAAEVLAKYGVTAKRTA